MAGSEDTPSKPSVADLLKIAPNPWFLFPKEKKAGLLLKTSPAIASAQVQHRGQKYLAMTVNPTDDGVAFEHHAELSVNTDVADKLARLRPLALHEDWIPFNVYHGTRMPPFTNLRLAKAGDDPQRTGRLRVVGYQSLNPNAARNDNVLVLEKASEKHLLVLAKNAHDVKSDAAAIYHSNAISSAIAKASLSQSGAAQHWTRRNWPLFFILFWTTTFITAFLIFRACAQTDEDTDDGKDEDGARLSTDEA